MIVIEYAVDVSADDVTLFVDRAVRYLYISTVSFCNCEYWPGITKIFSPSHVCFKTRDGLRAFRFYPDIF